LIVYRWLRGNGVGLLVAGVVGLLAWSLSLVLGGGGDLAGAAALRAVAGLCGVIVAAALLVQVGLLTWCELRRVEASEPTHAESTGDARVGGEQ
jgi:hypothetical protein